MNQKHKHWDSFIRDLCVNLFSAANRDIDEMQSREELLRTLFDGCNTKLDITKRLLEKYDVDTDKSLAFFAKRFGSCDCEIFINSRK